MSGLFARDDSFSFEVREHLEQVVVAVPDELREVVLALVTRSGKGLRRHLVEVCARFGRPDRARLVRLAGVVELLHLSSLLHDDVIDRATTRRGVPTAHEVLGHEAAVLAGAACMASAAAEAADLGPGVSTAFAVVTAELARGELRDLERSYDTSLEIEDYLDLVRRKTAELFKLCCVLGAGAAGLDRTTTHRLATFGLELGVAFQIADDCLDLRPDPGGKPAGTDHLLGLFGAPTLHALRMGTPGLATLLLSPALTVDELPRIRTLIGEAGGLAEADRLAHRHFDRAVEALGPLAATDPGQTLVRLQDVLWPN
jgi:geranylgeranyl pyrophosphate synthase